MIDAVHWISNYSLLLWRGVLPACFVLQLFHCLFTMSRDLTLKSLPEKLADFVFNSHWRRGCKKELCWTVFSSCAVVFQKAMKPECIDVGLLGTILQDLACFPLKGEDIHIQSC